MMRRLTPLVLILLATATCVGCDQITKDYARDHLLYGTRLTLVNDLVHLVYAENAGIAFGIGSALPSTVRFWLFIIGVVGVLMLIGVVAYRRRGLGKVFLGGITLVMAGGLSNLIDRLVNDGHVIDFLVLDVGGLRTIVFNLADVLVLVGTTVLIASALRAERRRGAEQTTLSEW